MNNNRNIRYFIFYRTVVITAITAITAIFYSTVVITKGLVIRIILFIEL